MYVDNYPWTLTISALDPSGTTSSGTISSATREDRVFWGLSITFEIIIIQYQSMIYSFDNYTPVIDPSSFIHPLAAVTGNVRIGKNVYIGPGAAIRGDWGGIVIEDGCNVQENCTIHMFPGITVYLQEGAHIGHGAVIHGAIIGRNCLVGMNAVIMDEVEIGDECIIGALTFIKSGLKIPARSVVAGNPGKIVKEVTDEMIQWKTEGTVLYQKLPAQCFESLRPVMPLRVSRTDTIPENSPPDYKPWKSNQ